LLHEAEEIILAACGVARDATPQAAIPAKSPGERLGYPVSFDKDRHLRAFSWERFFPCAIH
jgi:hypothetical protein